MLASLALLLWTSSALPEAPLVADFDDIRALGSPTEVLEKPRWIRHRIRYRERVSQIAARYGVRRAKLVEWNELDSAEVYPPKRRRTLKVRARRLPTPRMRVQYIPREGQTWGDIAAQLHVEIPDIRAWNWQRRTPSPTQPVVAWVEPSQARTVHPSSATADTQPVEVTIPAGAQSVGRPHRGRLVEGARLPESPLYTRGKTYALWGSTHTLRTLTSALANFRHDTGFSGAVVIGAISRKHGRRFPPHVSHQSGRDIDIRLPVLPGIPRTSQPNADEVDWYATWSLVHAFANTGETSMIFLEAGLHRRLYEAARTLGVSREVLAETLSWPSWKSRAPLVRHASGHDAHLHVRIKCGPDEPRCRKG